MRVWSGIKVIFSVALIIFGTQSIAIAKTLDRDVAGHIVLCTGHGPTTVLVDANGQPIGDQPICPECVVSFADLGAASFEVSPRIVELTPIGYQAAVIAIAASPILSPTSRGPPNFL